MVCFDCPKKSPSPFPSRLVTPFCSWQKEGVRFLPRGLVRLPAKNFTQSQALLPRCKKGKTAFLQRLFNIFWSQPEGNVVPFYFSVPETKATLASFSKDFFTAFSTQYLSFLTRNPQLVATPPAFAMLRPLLSDSFFRDLYDSIQLSENSNDWNALWMEYILKVFYEVNQRNVKRIMLYLFQKGKECSLQQIRDDLKLDMSDSELESKLQQLVFRQRYQKEIDHFVPDIHAEIQREMGRTSNPVPS